MIYDLQVRTATSYARGATAGRYLLRLLPRDGHGAGQRLLHASLDISPAPAERSDGVDFFGNNVTDACFADSHDDLVFTLRARVERTVRTAELDLSPPLAGLARELGAIRSLDAQAPHHFLPASPLVRPNPDIAAYAESRIEARMTVRECVEAVNRAIHADFAYDGSATEVDTPTEVAFAQKRGVCQDFAHVMIACLRELGIPAGYVSGLLRTEPPPGRPRLQGADAMHAWVQAWCGIEAGWLEFDPTNALAVGRDHIVVARGRDYSDVAPISGVLRTSGAQEIRQTVDVVPLE